MIKIPDFFEIDEYLEAYQIDEDTLNPVYKFVYDFEWADSKEVVEEWHLKLKLMVQYILTTKDTVVRSYEEIIRLKKDKLTPIDDFYAMIAIDEEIHQDEAIDQIESLKYMVQFLSTTNLSFDEYYID